MKYVLLVIIGIFVACYTPIVFFNLLDNYVIVLNTGTKILFGLFILILMLMMLMILLIKMKFKNENNKF